MATSAPCIVPAGVLPLCGAAAGTPLSSASMSEELRVACKRRRDRTAVHEPGLSAQAHGVFRGAQLDPVVAAGLTGARDGAHSQALLNHQGVRGERAPRSLNATFLVVNNAVETAVVNGPEYEKSQPQAAL